MDKRIRVAVDLDEVVVQFVEEITKYYNKLFNKNLKLQDYDGRFWSDVWVVTQDQVNRTICDFSTTFEFANLLPIPGSFDTLKKLKDTGHFEFYIVTARGEQLQKATMAWIEKHFDGIFSGIEFGNTFGQDVTKIKKEKSKICEELGCIFLIDDMKYNLQHCNKRGIQGILFNLEEKYPWCHGISASSPTEEDPYLKYAKNWKEVENILLSSLN